MNWSEIVRRLHQQANESDAGGDAGPAATAVGTHTAGGAGGDDGGAGGTVHQPGGDGGRKPDQGGGDGDGAGDGDGGADRVTTLSPDNWREYIAGEDAKELKRLQRFTDIKAVWKSARELERKVSSGELRNVTPPGPDASESEVAAWHKASGVPEKPEDYKAEFATGGEVEIEGDELESIRDLAHKANLNQSQFSELLSGLQDRASAEQERSAAEDQERATEVLQDLRNEWGAEFDVNMNLMKNSIVRLAGTELFDELMRGRMADGTPIGSNPEFLKFLVAIEREANPAATVMPNSAHVSVNTVADRMDELRKMMANPNSEYWKGPTAEKLQAEYRDLARAREKMAEREGG